MNLVPPSEQIPPQGSPGNSTLIVEKPLAKSRAARPFVGEEGDSVQKPVELPPSQNFPFKSQRKAHGYCATFAAAGFGFVTVILLSQAHITLGGTHHMLMFGSLALIATVMFSLVAYRDLFGKLVVDQNGLRSTPGLFGFKIRWDELQSYEWKSAAIKGLDGNQLWLWKSNASPIVFEAGWLSPRDRQALREWLGRKTSLSV